jgi:ABC-type transport system involved in cytochrome c biogenesis permease subunit
MMGVTSILIAAAVFTAGPAQGLLPETLDLEAMRALTVQHNGRWVPLDTVARDTVDAVTGTMHYQKQDPVLVMLGWTFDTQTWMNQPLIRIPNAELRGHLELPANQTEFSYSQLISHRPLLDQINALSHVEKKKLNPLESKVSDIHGQLSLLQRVFRNQVIRPVADPSDTMGAWRPITPPAGQDNAAAVTLQSAWTAVQEAFLADDANEFDSAVEWLTGSLNAMPTAYRPSQRLIETELRYNRIRPFRTAWMIMVAGALLSTGAMLIRRKWFDGLAIIGLIAGFGMLSYGLWLRWQIAGRIPASNMFESLLFLSWGMGAFAILAMLFLHQRIVPLTASAMGALALFLADVLPLDGFVRPIPPVLMDTIWMSIHVPIIMTSYSVLTLAVLFAHVQLVVMATAPRRQNLADTIDLLHYWYVQVGSILLLAGIVTGSMWAASSWGRYWGWDPKEVWSLVAFLGYLAILHVRVDHEKTPVGAYVLALILTIALFALLAILLAPITPAKAVALLATAAAVALFALARGPFATALKSILAFWLIIMTYVGVNYVLGIGLHSYGFGTGAIAPRMFLIAGIDLAVIALFTLIYLIRRAAGPPAAPAPA